MNIKEVDFVEELLDACEYFWSAGWGEFHAGNISYLLSDEEIAKIQSFLEVKATVPFDYDVEELAGNKVAGVAVVSAIFAKEDIEAATRELKMKTEKMVKA